MTLLELEQTYFWGTVDDFLSVLVNVASSLQILIISRTLIFMDDDGITGSLERLQFTQLQQLTIHGPYYIALNVLMRLDISPYAIMDIKCSFERHEE